MNAEERYKKIMGRQENFNWGDKYQAAICAVASEAPRGSRVCRINSLKLGRVLNCLSTPERIFIQFALFNPSLIDIHEQKMLSQFRAVHPLHGHPQVGAKKLQPVCGTLEAAIAIGMDHYLVLIHNDGGREWVAYPYVGDILLYLRGPDGMPYAVNWNVKDVADGFLENNRGVLKSPRQSGLDKEKVRLRTMLEEYYYLSAGIRTVRMSRECLDKTLVCNIYLLYGLHENQIDLDALLLEDFSADLLEAVETGKPLAHVAIEYGRKWGRRDQLIAKIYQDIWCRNLKIDMFQPIQIDRPMQFEEVEVHSVYAHYFAEVAE